MTSFIRKLYVAATVLLLTNMSPVYAGSQTCEECEECCSAPPCCNGRGFISADFLYWTAHQNGFSGGCIPDTINNYVYEDGFVESKIKGNSRDIKYKWDPGFRLGTGYEFGGQPWDIAAYWTHFHTHNHEGRRPNHFNWKLDYDVIDVLIGRKFSLECFAFRPFIGIRGAQIDEKVKSSSLISNNIFFNGSSSYYSSGDYSYDYYEYSDSSILNHLRAEENSKQKFRGIGPLIGIEADWNWGCGFSLYGYISVSSLYGHFHNRFNGFNSFLDGANNCEKKAYLYSCQLSTDALLGIRWEKCFCNDLRVIFQFALEQHRYFDNNHIGGYGDLCLDGFSFSGIVSF